MPTEQREKRGRGRPSKAAGEVRSVSLQITVTPSEKLALDVEAKKRWLPPARRITPAELAHDAVVEYLARLAKRREAREVVSKDGLAADGSDASEELSDGAKDDGASEIGEAK